LLAGSLNLNKEIAVKTRIYFVLTLFALSCLGQVARAEESAKSCRRAYAIHEAGHAGFALMFPKLIHLNSVYIIPNPTSDQRGSTDTDTPKTPGNRDETVKLIALRFAGEVAEELLNGKARPNVASQDRVETAVIARQYLGESADTTELLDAGRTLAREVLSMHYANLNRLADALCARTSLTGQEAKAIWE
jgi:ATP-dependent Zn protease